MKITYDLDYLPDHYTRFSRTSELTMAVIAFLGKENKNMCIEFDNEDMAHSKCKTLRSYRNKHKLQDVIDVYDVGRCVYVVKIKKKK